MKIIKNIIAILMIMLLSIMLLGTCVNATTSVSIKASKSKVTVGENVSITVSFNEKVSAAQFILKYDTSKFDYISCSREDDFNPSNNRFVYVNPQDNKNLQSVTFTFKSLETGSGSFSISGVVLSSDHKISNSSTTVTVEKATTTSSNTNNNSSSNSSSKTTSTSNNKTSSKTTTKKSTSTSKSTTSNNNSNNEDENLEEENNEQEGIAKPELDELKLKLNVMVESDYTEESWNALQEVIASAENASTESEYEELKDKLTIESLETVAFEKEELEKVLRDLIGKAERDYTEESWQELQEAISIADNTNLKSEYDAVKDKLTTNNLVLDEKGSLEKFTENVNSHGTLILALSIIIVGLIIIIIVLSVLYKNERETSIGTRRIK